MKLFENKRWNIEKVGTHGGYLKITHKDEGVTVVLSSQQGLCISSSDRMSLSVDEADDTPAVIVQKNLEQV